MIYRSTDSALFYEFTCECGRALDTHIIVLIEACCLDP